MPATAGRVRMPANNRMQTSSSLNTHGIWQNAIGYDPYAGDGEEKKAGKSAEADGNAFESMKGLLALAKMQHGATGTEDRGGWNGRGKLRGGWVAGKDLGEVVEDKPASKQIEMPSSTESDSSDESGDEITTAARATRPSSSHAGEDRKRKRDKERKSKSEKKHKKEKKEKKHKKEKKEKKHKKHKRRSDSD